MGEDKILIVHAAFHAVDPTRTPEIDFNNPIHKDLVEHGLIISDYKNMDVFSDGLVGRGIIGKIPVIGKWQAQYSNYLFSDYIPRIKMAMAQKALATNKVRYKGNLDADQILSLTADQANAAFGELNYAKMGRNPTLQDVATLTLLAPDFLEARIRFVAQGFRPYGGLKNVTKIPEGASALHPLRTAKLFLNEQTMAVAIRGAIGMYVPCRIMNALLNDGDTHSEKPFSIVYNGEEYSLRSVPGDVLHLVTDPQGFVKSRINPATIGLVTKIITKKDNYGRSADFLDIIRDQATGMFPIPFQSFFSGGQRTLVEGVLSSSGINSYKYKTNFQRQLGDQHAQQITTGSTRTERLHNEQMTEVSRKYEKAIRNGDSDAVSEAEEMFSKKVEEGKLYPEDYDKIKDRVMQDPIERYLKETDVERILSVWKHASDEEKQRYIPVVINRIQNLQQNNPGKFDRMKDKIGDFYESIQ